MARKTLTVELDDDTIRDLTTLGDPVEVLSHLAHSVAEGVRRPDRAARAHTDDRLGIERRTSDVAISKEREAIEGAADHVVRVARARADEVVRTARDDAAGEGRRSPPDTEARSARARTLLEHERSDADAVLADEREDRRSDRADVLAAERADTDQSLFGERAHSDRMLVDQRDANEQMVRATIRAHELAIEADEAKARAEKSEKELREVAEFREMFIGMLGHDLRNPIGAIVMSAGGLLQRGTLHDQDAQAASRILRSSDRISRMITQLLDLTRARLGGGLPIERRTADLGDICRDIVAEFDANVRLDVEGDVTGTWDSDRLAQVVSNLSMNAIEYATPGTVVVVKARADGAEVVVEVTNQGDPIPAHVLPVIFEPFRRARERRKSANGNLGLGLYIAREIVLAHGGSLDAHSADGGTTFVMRLPRHAPVADGR